MFEHNQMWRNKRFNEDDGDGDGDGDEDSEKQENVVVFGAPLKSPQDSLS